MATATTVSTTKETQAFSDEDVVTVLHGWGVVRHNDRHYIDNILFEGGVARNVPYTIAKHWKAGTRPDGKPAIGRVKVHLLPNDANEVEFARATGIQPMKTNELAAMILATDKQELLKSLGPQRMLELSQELSKLAKAQL